MLDTPPHGKAFIHLCRTKVHSAPITTISNDHPPIATWWQLILCFGRQVTGSATKACRLKCTPTSRKVLFPTTANSTIANSVIIAWRILLHNTSNTTATRATKIARCILKSRIAKLPGVQIQRTQTGVTKDDRR